MNGFALNPVEIRTGDLPINITWTVERTVLTTQPPDHISNN